MPSGVTPLAASTRPAAPSRSWARPIKRCSVETYSSLRRSASVCARSSATRRRSLVYWPLAPRTLGIRPSSASSARWMASGRAPSFPSSGPTTPSRCWMSACSRCSGSIAWWPCWSASDCAAWSASWALTVSLSNRFRRDSSSQPGTRVVARALEERVPGHGHDQVEVTTPARRPAALAGYAHALARADAGGGLDVELAARALPAAALAGRAGLAADVARALTGGAGLVHLERQRLACPLERLVEGDLHGGLDVLARSAGAAGAESAEEILGVAAAACPVAHPDTEIPENRPEEVGEVAEVARVTAVLHTEAAGAGTGRALGVAVPVGSQAVVPPALLVVGENLVRLVDLLEALAAVLALGHVGVVFP